MPKATTGDPKKVIDWNTMAQSSPEARGVLSRFNRIQPKVTATKTAESAAETLAKEQVSARGSNVIQPESIRAMRGLASQERRLPRTLGEDGSAN